MENQTKCRADQVFLPSFYILKWVQ